MEPRAGIKWDIDEKQSVKAGIGVHSQTQPSYIYLHQVRTKEGQYVQHNRNIGLTKSRHAVVGYNRIFGDNFRLLTEAYYQQLSNVPVEINSSSFSMLNQGVGFTRLFADSLVNNGKGENYGAEVTLEKFFSNGYFFMITNSFYESFYWGSDNVKRDTDFNGNYILNFLGAKEFVTKTKNVLTIGGKVTYAGNKRYGDIDTTATILAQEIIFGDNNRNEYQFDPYFRADLKLNYKINRIKVSHEIALDIFNLLDTKNLLKISYAPNLEDPQASPVREEYQYGRLPIFYYRLNI